MIIRKANHKDINEIVKLHLSRFNNFFLSSLGEFFLVQFYISFLRYPGILLVLEDEDKIQGFAAGSFNNKGFFKKLLLNNIFGFLRCGFHVFFSNPKAIKRILSNVKCSDKQNIEYAELLSIATLKNSKGYGKSLLKNFENEIWSKINSLPISLTTDYFENQKAIDFYTSNGYQVYDIFESYQHRKMYRFIKYN